MRRPAYRKGPPESQAGGVGLGRRPAEAVAAQHHAEAQSLTQGVGTGGVEAQSASLLPGLDDLGLMELLGQILYILQLFWAKI